MKRPKILVVGSFVMDLVVSAPKFPSSGETVIGSGFQMAAGGKGANQAVQAALLGASVTMVGKVGQDHFGGELLDSVHKAGVDVVHVSRAEDAPSAIGNVQLEVTQEHTANRIVVVPGANMHLTTEDVSFLEEEIAQYDMVLLQLEIPMEVNRVVAQLARSHKVPVMLNTAPYTPVPQDILSAVTYISPNEHEAADMTGMAITDIESAQMAIASLRQTGIENVIITMGHRGAVFGNAAVFFHSPCIAGVKVQDPTAAGDSFVGAFCTGICYGLDPQKAMKFANYTASLTVSRIGAQPSLPMLDEVKAFMAQHKTDTRDILIRI